MATATGAEMEVKWVKRRFGLSGLDWQAVAYVQKRHCIRTASEAIRLCLQQQWLRDRVIGTQFRSPNDPDGKSRSLLIGDIPPTAVYLSEAAEVAAGVSRGLDTPVGLAKLRQWICRFWPQDERHLEHVQAGWHLSSAVEAIRLSVRLQAAGDGFKKPDGGWV